MALHREQLEQKTKQQAALLGYEYIDSTTLPKNKSDIIWDILSPKEIKKHQMVPLGKHGTQLVVAITIQTKRHSLQWVIDKFRDFQFRFVIISDEGFMEYLAIYIPPVEVKYDDIDINSSEKSSVARISKTLNSVKGEDILDYLVDQASQLNASDLHFESQKEDVRMRFRVDGTLHEIARLSKDKYRQLESSLAVLAGISSASSKAQTGHWTQVAEGDGEKISINMRIETVPTVYGHDAVLRLFTLDSDLLSIDNLGIRQSQKDVIKNATSHESGMTLVVGPTGSGKTTTLYSILNDLNTDDRKIITLEDPVEYAIDGITQIPVDSRKGDSFAEGLRTVLRLDPDVIMVGEIRDADTAITALQASLTGHLVLSTFHASTSTKALSRLLELTDNNTLLLSALKLILAQRLVRKLDDNKIPDQEGQKSIADQIDSSLDNFKLGDEKRVKTKIYKHQSTKDNPFGFRGRFLALEQLTLNDEMQDYLRKNVDSLDTSALEKIAKEVTNFNTLSEEVLYSVASSKTSYIEALKHIDLKTID